MSDVPHVDYPHEPGRLPYCLACEAQCWCNPGIGWAPELGVTPCIYCVEQEEAFGERDDTYGDADADRMCGCGAVGTHGVDHQD